MTFDNSFLKNDGNRQNDNNHVCFYVCVYPRGCQRSQVTKGVQFTGGTRRKNEAEVRESGVSLHEVKGKPAAREGLRPLLTACCRYRAPLRKNSKGKNWKEKEKEANRFSPGSRYGWVIKNTGVSVHLNFLTSCHCYQSRWSVSLCWCDVPRGEMKQKLPTWSIGLIAESWSREQFQ